MKKKAVLYLMYLLWGAAFIYACSGARDKQAAIQDTLPSPTEAGTIKDPNDPKPMALMMRKMADDAQDMKELIEKGNFPDSLKFPFIRFYLAEPTDPSVLEPQFYENARLFQEAYHALFRNRDEQKKYYNLVIGKCITCHESYCSGPLKRIRKFILK